MEDNWLNPMKLLKRILISTKTAYHLKNNLIYKCKTEGRSPKDVSVYQNPIDLFKNLRHGNINPREVLKNQINLKWNLVEIKKEIQNQDQKIK